ncbi:MAG: hypothetical protein HYW09_00380 [Candidatus Niyogibacteria bacterium]|nr:hypothetical protein [Candidatus Niyogibacteria bacterium]
MEPTQENRGSWKLERTIEFFHHGSCVAVVDLIGQKFDRVHEGLDNGTCWTVTQIRYFQSFTGWFSDFPKDPQHEIRAGVFHSEIFS